MVYKPGDKVSYILGEPEAEYEVIATREVPHKLNYGDDNDHGFREVEGGKDYTIVKRTKDKNINPYIDVNEGDLRVP